MHDLALIEECYKKFSKNLKFLIPEGIFFINLELLHHFDLLHFHPSHEIKDPLLNRTFQFIESSEKITLLNNDFIIWIIPDNKEQSSYTYAIIALNKEEPQLEAAFIASGVYNTSTTVLKVLDKFLSEIQETEKSLSKYS